MSLEWWQGFLTCFWMMVLINLLVWSPLILKLLKDKPQICIGGKNNTQIMN